MVKNKIVEEEEDDSSIEEEEDIDIMDQDSSLDGQSGQSSDLEDEEEEEIEEIEEEEEETMTDTGDKPITSRQKALMGGGSGIDPNLPTNRRKKELTEEMKQKKNQIALTRKLKKIEETETLMKDVVNQLLTRKVIEKPEKEIIKKPTRHEILLNSMGGKTIRTIDNETGKTVSYPPNHEMINRITIDQQNTKNNSNNNQSQSKPNIIKCSAPNCNNPKRYNCPKNNLPVCNIECWKKVMSQTNRIDK
ncbi:hypothetical protein DLAC_08808 [Tieghemostelium lacteum]|uniref:HIT-type domain-containing protein n=1 Tax=Tieghemostelium lacteum TaxID=361077 RepID=A0A151Z8F4_TIELA|nr:hypothetical protein DLAC_08808 [Tieghemostelium lacteum]|eukprot:KYQ90208.1 hypothetical protein DLAC_08808 [Tieghemostelium lacteum]